MPTNVLFTQWASKPDLLHWLATFSNRSLLLEDPTARATCFHSCTVPLLASAMGVGLASRGLSRQPAGVLFEEPCVLLIGHDTWLTRVDLTERSATRIRLDGVVFEFVSLDAKGCVLVHELGALRTDGEGRPLWKVDTDAVENHHLDPSGNLVLSIMDTETPLVLSVASGSVIRAGRDALCEDAPLETEEDM